MLCARQLSDKLLIHAFGLGFLLRKLLNEGQTLSFLCCKSLLFSHPLSFLGRNLLVGVDQLSIPDSKQPGWLCQAGRPCQKGPC